MSRAYESIGEIIRDTLISRGQCFGSELYRVVQEQIERKISHESFRKNYLYKMEKLGLIRKTRTGTRPRAQLKPTQYWELVPEKKAHLDLWRSPQIDYERRFRKKQNEPI